MIELYLDLCWGLYTVDGQSIGTRHGDSVSLLLGMGAVLALGDIQPPVGRLSPRVGVPPYLTVTRTGRRLFGGWIQITICVFISKIKISNKIDYIQVNT